MLVEEKVCGDGEKEQWNKLKWFVYEWGLNRLCNFFRLRLVINFVSRLRVSNIIISVFSVIWYCQLVIGIVRVMGWVLVVMNRKVVMKISSKIRIRKIW